ncbi:Cna B-type domain-containing protein [Candidatus Saccharibacteria bacterium]|nr:Cna B-type domain-containing protein [Candidatus Saccharibacteria bacterium]
MQRGAGGGTNWEDALDVANSVDFGDQDKTYIIFVSDGDPTFRNSRREAPTSDCYDSDGYGSNWRCNLWGNGQTDPDPHRNYAAAKAIADEIVANPNKELYAVGTFGESKNMKNIGGTYYDAANQDALETAFADIVKKITMGISVADLQIEDGITSATSTEIDGTAGNFRYNVPESWGDDWAEATYDGSSVHWNPGEYKTLTDKQTASVTFTVWPSQKAMDCIASLRNDGTCTESDLAKFGLGVRDDGSFYLITNSTATFRFKTATRVEGSDEIEYSEISIPIEFTEERDPTNLPETELQVTKKWADELDLGQRNDIDEVSLELYVDGKKVRDYVFNEKSEDGSEWTGQTADAVYYYTVAPGVMKRLDNLTAEEAASLRGVANETGGGVVTVNGVEYAILEKGHDYEFANENYDFDDEQNPNGSNHYQITKRTFHPMIVDDGLVHDVVFDNTNKTATIDSVAMTKLSAENTLKGGILVSKVVKNNGVVDKTIEDEYEITIENIKLGDEVVSGEYRVNTYEEDGETLTPDGKGEKKQYTGTITEKIKTNQKIMVIDAPTGTTFSVKETQPKGYEDYKISYQLMRKDKDGNKIISTEPEDIQKVFGNASAQAIVTNTLESGDLIIKKNVTASSGDLSEARKKLFGFTVYFYEHEGDANPVRVDDSTCNKKDDDVDNRIKHGETCTIENIPKGWYYKIVEDKVAGFNNGEEKVETGTIKEGDNEETFNNNYAVTPLDPKDAKVTAIKAFASGYEPFWISSDEFTFVMTGNGQTIESEPLTLFGDTAEFTPTITDAGTYTYTITEKTTDANSNSLFRDGVSRLANDEDIVVTIVVRDKGDGTLELVSKTYSKTSQTIYNIYEGDNTYGGKEGELEFTKNLTGRDWRSSDKFDFTISSATDGAPMPKETTITADKDHKTVGFGKIKFTNKDVGKTYTYTVTESFDVPSVEATGTSAGGISLTIEVKFNDQTGKIDLIVSDYEDTFTNEYKTTNVTAAKVWDDDGDRDGLRKNYENYYVAVKNDEGKYVAYEKLALVDKNDYIFTNLPEKNAAGEEIDYEIVEASTCSGSGESIECTEFEKDDDYTATVKDGEITNYHKPELYDTTGDLIVQKIWAGEGNELVRPGLVSVVLLANGKVINKADIVASQNNEWTYTFTGLYLNDGGEPIEYSVQESKIGETVFGENESVIIIRTKEGAIAGSWTKSESGHNVTNTWKEAKDEIVYDGAKKFYIKKVDENYKPMAGVTFAIEGANDRQTDSEGMASKTISVSSDEKEDDFEFVISEKETLEGYDLVEGSATIAVSCSSVLSDPNPSTLVNTYTKTCEIDKSGSDKYVWDAEELTLTVVNKRSLAKSLTIKKTVKGLSPEVLTDLEFTIAGPEDFGEDGEMTLKVSEDCVISGEVITCRVEGKVPTGKYIVTESNADVENFELTVSGDNDVEKKIKKDERAVFEITNEYEVDKISYSVVKIWDDAHDKDGKRPDTLLVKLLANGDDVETVNMSIKDTVIIDEEDEEYTTGDVWIYVWEELPYADEYAEVISYTAEENLESDDYEQTETESDEYYTLFVNTHELDDPCTNGGGCGGGIVSVAPPLSPNTGRLIKNEGTLAMAEGEMVNMWVGGIAVIVLVGLGLAFQGAKRKK